MDDYTREIVTRGGEGIMLRRAGSEYVNGRSGNLVKHKVKVIQALRVA